MLSSTDINKCTSFIVVLLACLVFSFGNVYAADHSVAHVTQFKGAVTIERGSGTIAIAKGARLKNEDSLSTGPDGSIGIVFDDETTLSLGPNSKMTIQEYVFDTDRSQFSFVVNLLKGTASYVSGLIAKLSPDSARFITPSASIGVRGTKFVIEVEPL